MKILHLSDVHVTQDYRLRDLPRLGWRRAIAYGELTLGGRIKAYARAEESLRGFSKWAIEEKIDHLIVSGDLTAYATEEEFSRAQVALKPWSENGARCSMIPGNHDVYTPASLRERRFHQYFDKVSQGEFPEFSQADGFPYVKLLRPNRDENGVQVDLATPEAVLIALRTPHVPRIPGDSYGEVGEFQLDVIKKIRVDSRFSGLPVAIALHHAPQNPDGTPDTAVHGLKDTEALYEVVPGPRFALLFGHLHARFFKESNGRGPHLVGAGSSTEAGHEGGWVLTPSKSGWGVEEMKLKVQN